MQQPEYQLMQQTVDWFKQYLIVQPKYMHNRSTVLSRASHYCFMQHHTIDPGGTKTEYGINKIVW